MANELEALIRQIVSEIEGAKGNTTQYSAPHTSSTSNTTVGVSKVSFISFNVVIETTGVVIFTF